MLIETTKELLNGLIIIGGIYFLIMELWVLTFIFFVFLTCFIFYGTNRTLKSNFAEGKTN
jgi:uncharacterized membrane protein